MGKSRGLRRVSFSSSGAIRTTCSFFALPRLPGTRRREWNVGTVSKEHLQRTRRHVWAVAAAGNEEEDEEEDGDGDEDDDREGMARVLEEGIERQMEAIFIFSSLSLNACLLTPTPDRRYKYPNRLSTLFIYDSDPNLHPFLFLVLHPSRKPEYSR